MTVSHRTHLASWLAMTLLAVVAWTIPGAAASPPAMTAEADAEEAPGLESRGQRIFRYDTFGSEQFFTGALALNEAVETVPPITALAVGLKVDVDALPEELIDALLKGLVDLEDPAVTVALLELDAVVGLAAQVENGQIESLGITCALCHSTVDDSLVPGIGQRLDQQVADVGGRAGE
mgnify:FL=1